MDVKLVLQLSLFGLAMAFGTVFLIPSNIEPLCWLAIFLICAYVIAVRQTPRPFFHGIAVGIVNSIWVTSAHVALYSQYMATPQREAEMMRTATIAPRLMMAIVGPIVGVVSGILLGLFALVAVRMLRARAGKQATST